MIDNEDNHPFLPRIYPYTKSYRYKIFETRHFSPPSFSFLRFINPVKLENFTMYIKYRANRFANALHPCYSFNKLNDHP